MWWALHIASQDPIEATLWGLEWRCATYLRDIPCKVWVEKEDKKVMKIAEDGFAYLEKKRKQLREADIRRLNVLAGWIIEKSEDPQTVRPDIEIIFKTYAIRFNQLGLKGWWHNGHLGLFELFFYLLPTEFASFTTAIDLEYFKDLCEQDVVEYLVPPARRPRSTNILIERSAGTLGAPFNGPFRLKMLMHRWYLERDLFQKLLKDVPISVIWVFQIAKELRRHHNYYSLFALLFAATEEHVQDRNLAPYKELMDDARNFSNYRSVRKQQPGLPYLQPYLRSACESRNAAFLPELFDDSVLRTGV